MTVEEFLALPDVEGLDRELIRGELRESPSSTHTYQHAYVMANLAYELKAWVLCQPPPRGIAVCGGCGVILGRDPDTVVGVDVAYLAPEHAARTDPDAAVVDGPPCLMVEISSPTDTEDGINGKVRDYLDSGARQVWVVDPDFETVVVHRPEAKPVLFNATQAIPGDPELPGLSIPVAGIFAIG